MFRRTGAQYTDWRATQLWEIEKLLHKNGYGEYNKDLTSLIYDVPTVCADPEQVESYLAVRFFEESYADMPAEAEDAAAYRKGDAIGVRNCFMHLKKTPSALHEHGAFREAYTEGGAFTQSRNAPSHLSCTGLKPLCPQL